VEINSSFKVLIVALVAVCLQFAWQGHKGFSLWDEGFLWYGVQRVLLGEVPLRDFMSYDPGRYYWSAILLGMFGDNSIVGLRMAAAAFQALGLFVGLMLILLSERRPTQDRIAFLVLSSAILMVWMFPRHKLFDISLSIFLIGVLTFLISNPQPKRYFLAGFGIGLAAVFGRNHGLYGVVGSLGVITWLCIRRVSWTRTLQGVTLWGGGVVAGYLPVILMLVLVPGFASAFWESILFLLEQKATNLPLPVPGPWQIALSASPPGEVMRAVLVGVFFVGLLVFGGLALLYVVRREIEGKPATAALVAAAFLALPYAHFAYSRADVGHLAQGIFPMLLGCLILLNATETKIKWSVATSLGIASVWVMHPLHPGWQCSPGPSCVTVEVSGNILQVDRHTANDIALLRGLASHYAPDGRRFLAAPFWPGAYALLQRKSPMWEIYALFSRTEAAEKKEIERIEDAEPGFAIILDLPLDGRDELRFKNTHPLIHQYIVDAYDPLPGLRGPAYQIYKARSAEQ